MNFLHPKFSRHLMTKLHSVVLFSLEPQEERKLVSIRSCGSFLYRVMVFIVFHIECFITLDKHLLPALLQSQWSMNSASPAPLLHPSSPSEGYVCSRVELV